MYILAGTAIFRLRPPFDLGFPSIQIRWDDSLICIIPKTFQFEAAEAIMVNANLTDAELYLEDLTLSHSVLISCSPTELTPHQRGEWFVGVVENSLIERLGPLTPLPVATLIEK